MPSRHGQLHQDSNADSICLLHGFAHTPYQWQPLFDASPALAKRATALSLPFHLAPAVASFSEAIDALAAALPQQAKSAVHLVGYSLGARLALGLALRYPARVASLSLLCGHIGLEDEPSRRARAQADKRWQSLLREQGMDAFLAAFRAQALFGPPQSQLTPVLIEGLRRRRARDARALADSFDVLGLAAMPNYWPALKDLRMPVTFVVGERDQKFVALSRRAQALVSAPTRLVVVKNAYHDVIAADPTVVSVCLQSAVSSLSL